MPPPSTHPDTFAIVAACSPATVCVQVNDLLRYKQQCSAVEVEREDLRAQIASLHAKLEAAKSGESAVGLKLSDVVTERDSCRSQLTTVSAQLEQSRGDNVRLVHELEAGQRRVSQLQQLVVDVEDAAKAAREECSAALRRCRDGDVTLAELRQTVADYKDTTDRLTAQVESLRGASPACRVSIVASRCASLAAGSPRPSTSASGGSLLAVPLTTMLLQRCTVCYFLVRTHVRVARERPVCVIDVCARAHPLCRGVPPVCSTSQRTLRSGQQSTRRFDCPATTWCSR
jgi:hypothetical protein